MSDMFAQIRQSWPSTNNLFSTERLFSILSQCKELVEINLSYNMLNGSIPDTVDNLVRLQKLNVHENK